MSTTKKMKPGPTGGQIAPASSPLPGETTQPVPREDSVDCELLVRLSGLDLTTSASEAPSPPQQQQQQQAKSKKKKKRKGPKAKAEGGSDIVVEKWDQYFGRGDLGDWQRFMGDLGLEGDFSSKTKCRKALRPVWINIRDFLECQNKPQGLKFFGSRSKLAEYTLSTRKIYPNIRIPKGSPLRELLAHIM